MTTFSQHRYDILLDIIPNRVIPIEQIIERIKLMKNEKLEDCLMRRAEFLQKDGTKVEFEKIKICGQSSMIRRVFLVSYSNYPVGWVVDYDLDQCMICTKEFNWLKFKHHCRACGSLICSNCSPYKTNVPNIEEEGGSRVCTNCFGLKTDSFE